MNLYQLDEFIITSPLSKEKRIEYLKLFFNKAYLNGIDRGTNLEIIRQEKIKKLHKQRLSSKFQIILDDLYNLINISEKRVYREKYKGRYNYYKQKTNRPKKIKKVKPKPTNYKISELW